MLDAIDALVALETFGTVSEAATRLRLTQSAVSKRIRSLQDQVGFRLVEPDGRKLRLTPRAVDFLDRARPLLAELRGLTKRAALDTPASLSVALADSVASSWGPAVIRRVLDSLPGANVDLHAHRSVLVIESVRLGRYDVGLCTQTTTAKDLIQHPILDEPMVLVTSKPASAASLSLPLIAIEPSSATWRAILPALRAHYPHLAGGNLVFVESFGAVVQMVNAGFGNGIVPLGLAMEMRLSRRNLRQLLGVERRLALFTRKSLHLSPSFIAFREQLAAVAREHFEQRKRDRPKTLLASA
jgi:DNA-binding transcriptional LysR family regulator